MLSLPISEPEKPASLVQCILLHDVRYYRTSDRSELLARGSKVWLDQSTHSIVLETGVVPVKRAEYLVVQ